MMHPTTMQDFSVGCVILAAGAGARFGEPKAGALISPDVRFVDAIVTAARTAGLTEIVAVMHPDVAPPVDVRTVVNRNAQSEQIASVRLGLGQLVNSPIRGAFIWPVDHPFVTAETIRELLSFITTHKPTIALPICEGKHGHPGYFSRDVWRDLVTVREGGAKAVIRQFATEVVEIPVLDRGVLRDIDLRADL